jgi:hypothetical protein
MNLFTSDKLEAATYAIVGFLKRSEGLDAFHYKSNFNPFHLSTHS